MSKKWKTKGEHVGVWKKRSWPTLYRSTIQVFSWRNRGTQ